MENNPFASEVQPDLSLGNSRTGRTLQERVTAAAEAILEQGLRPTVTRVRAAMGGGSPNDIAPALKHWKDVVLPAQGRTAALEKEGVGIPPIVADVVRELWSRALAAASVEIRGGASRQKEAAQDEQVKLMRQETTMLRDRLQREAQAYGELRAQNARHEVIAKDALSRAANLETSLASVQQTLSSTEARVIELEARLKLAVLTPRKAANAKPAHRKSADPRRTKGRARKAKTPAMKQNHHVRNAGRGRARANSRRR